ncbi:MAG: hypothetical protein Q4E34_00190 [Synergistaceae bacterium]|nr:hypothetical protein [Synergistaceae bacterium]
MLRKKKNAFALLETVLGVTLAFVLSGIIYSLTVYSEKIAVNAVENYTLQKYCLETLSGLEYSGKYNTNCRYAVSESTAANGYAKIVITPKNSVVREEKNATVFWKK